MRKKVTQYLLLIFLLFALSGGIAIMALSQVTKDLKSVITLHKLEIIRQNLVINLQTVQTNLYTIGTSFGPDLDVIVDNVNSLDKAITSCTGCHHSAVLTRKLIKLKRFTEKYKEALSAFITTTANPERVKRLQMATAEIGEMLLQNTREMAFMTNQKLKEKSGTALRKVERIKQILLASLLSIMLIGCIIAVNLTGEILKPIRELSEAARAVASGNLGYTIDSSETTEFGHLARVFNEMSLSLKEGHERNMNYMMRLSGLYRLTLSFHMVTNKQDIIREMVFGVAEIIRAEKVLVFLYNRERDRYASAFPAYGFADSDVENWSYEPSFINSLYLKSNKRSIIILPEDHVTKQLLLRETDNIRNLAIIWLKQKGILTGFLMTINKEGAEFVEEDIRLLSVIANNFSVAMDNAQLYRDLHTQMQKLKDTQEQLVQAAKLAAIGELAANIAHEINNPLTSILGYAELMREEEDIESIMRDLEIIESESLRARDIVRQLLEFSKKWPLKISKVDINRLLKDVIDLISLNLKDSEINIVDDFSDIPQISADASQLKQVFLNLINNAVQSMPNGGTLSIRTAKIDNSVMIEVSDTGTGIPDNVAQKIFEPFFTTKKDRGTGLGLPISYRIIKKHGGKIEVKKGVDKGTTFRVILPIRISSLQISP
ncbi:Phosphate regulon sensor protein PhoR (SphS) [hydrothermal vent metagenome]|uniref:histidine kinase n=1 Tax=hydrothermal vent metagenome TaxID=652676 RepID=A0A3B1DX41_9ZZZZ